MFNVCSDFSPPGRLRVKCLYKVYAVQTMYTIKQAAARAGLTVPVLRAWERRYGIVSPARTPSGYRLYDDAAIARVSAMRRLVETGMAPSAAAAAIASGRSASPEPRNEPGPRRRRRDLLAHGTVRRSGRGDGRVRGRSGPRRRLRDRFVRTRGRPLPVARPRGARRCLGGGPRRRRRGACREPRRPATTVGRLPGGGSTDRRPGGDPRGTAAGCPPRARGLAFATAARRAGLPILYLGADLPIRDWLGAAARTRARAAVIGVVTASDRVPAERVADGAARRRPEARGRLRWAQRPGGRDGGGIHGTGASRSGSPPV